MVHYMHVSTSKIHLKGIKDKGTIPGKERYDLVRFPLPSSESVEHKLNTRWRLKITSDFILLALSA